MRHRVLAAVMTAGLMATAPSRASMDDDPEAQALLEVFQSMTVTQTYLDDRLDGAAKGKITGGTLVGCDELGNRVTAILRPGDHCAGNAVILGTGDGRVPAIR